MKIFSNYLESKMLQSNVTYTFDEKTNNLIMRDTKSGKTWQPQIQEGGKYKRGFWKIPT